MTSGCPDNLLENLSMREKLIQRTMTFTEANVDFSVVMDNIFTASAQVTFENQSQSAGGAMLTTQNEDAMQKDLAKSVAFRKSMTKQMESKVTKQLMTLCSCLFEKPLIFTQSQSSMSKQIGTALSKSLQFLYSYRSNQEDIESDTQVQPVGEKS